MRAGNYRPPVNHWSDELATLKPCADALAWAREQDTPESSWATCERGDWMLWLLSKCAGGPDSDEHKQLVLAVCECARLALPYVRDGALRPQRAIETAENWVRSEGGTTIKHVRTAAKAAAAGLPYDAADAAARLAVTFAAAFATDAAYAAATAGLAVTFTANANAASAHSDARRAEVLGQCADIVRKHYPRAPEL